MSLEGVCFYFFHVLVKFGGCFGHNVHVCCRSSEFVSSSSSSVYTTNIIFLMVLLY